MFFFKYSLNREGPFNFQLGAGHVIQGLDRVNNWNKRDTVRR